MNVDRRSVLAIAICIVVMLLSKQIMNVFWPAPPPPPEKAAANAPADAQPAKPTDRAKPATQPSPVRKPPVAAIAPTTRPTPAAQTQPAAKPEPGPQIDLRDDLRLGGLGKDDTFEVQLTNFGAQVRWEKLARYRDGDVRDRPNLCVLAEEPLGHMSFGIRLVNPEPVDLTSRRWRVLDHSQTEVVFQTEAVGLRITKTFRLSPEFRYSLQMLLTFENLTAQPIPLVYQLDGPTGLPKENEDYSRVSRYVVVGERNKDGSIDYNYRWDYKTKEDEDYKQEWSNDPIVWAGVDSQYFSSVVIPETDDATGNWIESVETVALGSKPGQRWSPVTVRFRSAPDQSALGPAGGPDAKRTHTYRIFAGPKLRSVVEAEGIPELRTFGGFAQWISKIMVAVLSFFHSIIPSYGIAIILLTITVRVVMLPLSLKQHKSMHKMQVLQPEIQRINRDIKDKEQRGRAMMELYRREGVNPLGGCLPMFVQLPIFIGLYQGLLYAFELRQQGFLWISDLARPDMLFSFGFDIPWLGRHFNVLPLLTVVLMVYQQRTSQKPTGDPQQDQQRKIMSYMMIFIGFLFYWVASGLCMYFICSSLIHLVEQKFIGMWLGESRPTPGPTKVESEAESESPETAQKRDLRRAERAIKKRERQRRKQGRTRN